MCRATQRPCDGFATRQRRSEPTSSCSRSWCSLAIHLRTSCCGQRWFARPLRRFRSCSRKARAVFRAWSSRCRGPQDGHVHNAVALVADGRCELRFKHELPNYGVFDEKRVFTPGPLPDPVIFKGMSLGLPICEDIWCPDTAAHLARAGAKLLLVPNGSPFEVEKFHQRLDLARQRVSECGLPLAYVNQVGGQDELVFDGGSFVMHRDGTLAHLLPFWHEALAIARWHERGGRLALRRRRRMARRAQAGVRLQRHGPGAARLRAQERLPGRRARTLRRHRFGSDGRGRGRCTRSRPRTRRAASFAFHQPGQPGRCGRVGRGAGDATGYAVHRVPRGNPGVDAGAAVRRASA